MKPLRFLKYLQFGWFNDSDFFKYSELVVICKFKESLNADSRVYSLSEWEENYAYLWV
jgi:hypothetical protein